MYRRPVTRTVFLQLGQRTIYTFIEWSVVNLHVHSIMQVPFSTFEELLLDCAMHARESGEPRAGARCRPGYHPDYGDWALFRRSDS